MKATRTMLLAVALAVPAACGSSGGSESDSTPAAPEPAPAPAAPVNAVRADGFRFQPASLTVARGATVTWTNTDAILHTATAGTPGAPQPTFDVEMPDAGATGTATFTEPGTYSYFCRRHTGMKAEIVVR